MPSAQRIYERLPDETHYAGGYGTVKTCVRGRKAQIGTTETALVEFAWMPRVPHRIVLGNATGTGRKISGKVAETELFSGTHTHYGFSATCVNPDSGHETSTPQSRSPS